jgi:hypothetical protein
MTNKKDIYKDEFGNYQEVDEELEESIDGYEDDEQDHSEEDDSDDLFDSELDDDDSYYDEDEAYAREGQGGYDVDED